MTYTATATMKVKAPLARVWAALTEPAMVKQYFFGTDLVTDWKVGGALFFRGEWEGKVYEDRGTVKSFEPQRSFSYDYWSNMSGEPDVVERRALIRFDLSESGGVVEVKVTQSNMPTQARADDSAKNWPVVLEGMKRLVEAAR
ncbi:MAG: SRPBCC domain-containing protein [Myxococcaceae bacterium]|nr:SRPBCC domain-containing protein [Myxococcaceae bacterium]